VKPAVALVIAAGCGFRVAASGGEPSDGSVTGDRPMVAWWDPELAHRRALVVTTGAVRPDKGYAGYTVRLVLPRSELPDLATSCDDLRIVHGTTELVRHVAQCDATIDVRFALPVDVPDATAWREAELYYGNPAAAAPPSALGKAVYLWWDDASASRVAEYVHGRMDQWLSTGHDDSLAWNAGGYYAYDTGDDSQSGYRRAVDERDVLVEAEWFHTGCYQYNMQSGACLRVIPLSGTGASELSTHYYCSSRAQNPACANNDQGLYDGDIVRTDNEILAFDNPTDPPPIVANQWRKQALAAFGAGPTTLRFWDADAGWAPLAYPPAPALLASGTDATDHTGRGAAGIMTAQDIGRVRDLVIRRYVEPEPVVTYGAQEDAP